MTGPTYPTHGSVKINNNSVKYKLIRTAETDKDAPITITVPDNSVNATITYKRFKSNDTLTTAVMVRDGDKLTFMMPRQPAAGKMEYPDGSTLCAQLACPFPIFTMRDKDG